MAYLSREQCRAARGLLNWTQQDLATQTGLSKTSINNFERGSSNVKRDTLALIHKALTNQGLMFLEHDGLQRHKESFNILQGQQTLDKIFDDVLAHSLEGVDPILICVDHTMMPNPYFESGIKRLQKQRLSPKLYQNHPYEIPGMISFCYGLKLAFYYVMQQVGFIVESPQAQRAEKTRLQTAQNTIK